MAGRLTVQERAQIAARYEVWGCAVQVQRWWRTIKGKYAQIDPKTIKNCHKKLMTTGSVVDTQRNGRPSKSRDPEVVQVVQEMFTRSKYRRPYRILNKSPCINCGNYIQKINYSFFK